MEKNIVIVGHDIMSLSQYARQLASRVGYRYEDLSRELDKLLLSNIDIPLDLSVPLVDVRERELYYSFSRQEKTLTVVSVDMYLAHENYNIFKDCFVIYVDDEKNDKMLEKLVKKHVDLTIRQEKAQINELVKIIKG